MNTNFLPGYMSRNSSAANRMQVATWLLICALLVLMVAVLGGVTRLTHSGLSMVTWEPLTGIIPPLSEESWMSEFLHYQKFPEFQKINWNMNLEGFKSIFWLEYAHRLFARLIGITFALPLIFFLSIRCLEKSFALKLFGVFLLGGLQGVLGWLMVASGLIDHPDVSHYRLTAHLGLAVLIYIIILWLFLRVCIPVRPSSANKEIPRYFGNLTLVLIGLVYLLILSGGLVAGLDAGFAYNTFPKMDEQWIPEGLFSQNPFDSIEGVQFIHRWLGMSVGIFLILVCVRGVRINPPRPLGLSLQVVILTTITQGTLGILTLINVVPITLAALHQGTALILLAGVVTTAYLSQNHLKAR